MCDVVNIFISCERRIWSKVATNGVLNVREICSTNTTVMSNFGKFQGSFDLLRHLSDFLAI